MIISKIKKAIKQVMGDKIYRCLRKIYRRLRKINNRIIAVYSYCGHKHNYSKKSGHAVINIVFLVTEPQSWNSLKTVYEAALKRKNVKTYMVVVSCDTVRSDGSIIESYDYFKKICPEAINAVQGKEIFDIKKLSPDIIFRQTPYDGAWPKKYRYPKLSRYAKICYVPYGYTVSEKHLEINYNEIALSNIYAIFSECESNQSYCLEMRKTCRCYKELNVFYLGFPRLDLYSDSSWSLNKRHSFTFTWIPRWSLDSCDNDASNFFNYVEELLDYFQGHRDILLIIRPHPLMFDNFVQNGAMTPEQKGEFLKRIQQEPNICMDDNFDYLDTFRQTDVLIADLSSLNVEFFMTGRPIIYCGDTKGYMHEAEEMMRLWYKADDWKKLREYLENLSKGIDPDKEVREKAVKKFLDSAPRNAGEAIIEKCLEIV